MADGSSSIFRPVSGLPGLGPAAALTVIAVAIVALDPYLSGLVPNSLWRHLHLSASPYKIVPLALVFAVAATAAAWGLARSGSLPAAGILLLMIASQTNGFKIMVLDPLDVTFLFVFVVWCASRLGSGEKPVATAPVVWACLALLILNFPNILHERPTSFLGGSLSLLRCLLLAVLVLNLVSSSRNLDFAIRTLMAVTVASAVVGILQFILSYVFGIYLTLIEPAETAFKPTPIGMVMRSSAFCITAQHFSGLLTLTLPFMLFAVTEGSVRWRVAWAIGLGLILLGILLSWNFGAIFVAAAIVGLFPFFRWPRWSIQFGVTYLLGAGAAYFVGLIDLIYKLSFGNSGVAKGVSQRHTLMELGFTKLYRDPWIGEGVFGMAKFSGNFWGRPVHNAYLETMTEVGMIGGWVLIGMFLVLATQLLLAGAAARGRMASYLRASLLSVLGLMALMMSEPMMDNSNTWLMLALVQGALLIATGREVPVSTRDSRSAATAAANSRPGPGTAAPALPE